MSKAHYDQINGFIDFTERFPTEESCRRYLFKKRWPNGFGCPRCGGMEYSYISTRKLYQCSYCRHQVSVTAGTVMDKTRTSLKTWFWMMFLISNMRTGVSILGASRLLGISYKRAWFIAHKIRKAMQDRDERYRLSGLIELDDSYFGSRRSGKRGRGTTKRPVLVGVTHRGKGPGYASMKVLDSMSAEDVRKAATAMMDEESTVVTDGFLSYPPALPGFDHERLIIRDPRAASDKFPWVHVLIANAKGMIRGIHHGVSQKHLQAYLSEFCWRFSRRQFEGELFDRLLVACISIR